MCTEERGGKRRERGRERRRGGSEIDNLQHFQSLPWAHVVQEHLGIPVGRTHKSTTQLKTFISITCTLDAVSQNHILHIQTCPCLFIFAYSVCLYLVHMSTHGPAYTYGYSLLSLLPSWSWCSLDALKSSVPSLPLGSSQSWQALSNGR